MLESSPKDFSLSEAKAERCTPDFESIIKSANRSLVKSERFRDAALEYFDGRRARDKMAELIGELVTECKLLENQLTILLAAQEKEGGEAG